jgi:hypothetical protein
MSDYPLLTQLIRDNTLLSHEVAETRSAYFLSGRMLTPDNSDDVNLLRELSRADDAGLLIWDEVDRVGANYKALLLGMRE